MHTSKTALIIDPSSWRAHGDHVPSRHKRVCLIFRRPVSEKPIPRLVCEQGLTIHAVFDVISVFEDFYDVEIGPWQPAFGVISRRHLKCIRLIFTNNSVELSLFVNHSLQVVTRVPRLSVVNCFLVLSGTRGSAIFVSNRMADTSGRKSAVRRSQGCCENLRASRCFQPADHAPYTGRQQLRNSDSKFDNLRYRKEGNN
jgi:hypothetical protein